MLAKLRVIAVGKLKESYLRAAVEDFATRLKPYAELEIVEVASVPDPAKPSPALVQQVLDKEAELILRRVREDESVVALDRGGRELASEGMAELLLPHCHAGTRVAFAIGGSLGLGRAVLHKARNSISLSKLTFPHGLARLILLEQIYRAFKIMRQEKYHK